MKKYLYLNGYAAGLNPFTKYTYYIDFCIRVTHIAHNAAIFHFVHMLTGYDVFIASGRDHNVNRTNDLVQFNDTESVHTEKSTIKVNGH